MVALSQLIGGSYSIDHNYAELSSPSSISTSKQNFSTVGIFWCSQRTQTSDTSIGSSPLLEVQLQNTIHIQRDFSCDPISTDIIWDDVVYSVANHYSVRYSHVAQPQSSTYRTYRYGTISLWNKQFVALVTVELPYLGCTSVPRRLPQDSDTAGPISLSQPVGPGSGLG